MSQWWVVTEYSIHRVQHTPSTTFTPDYLPSLHCHDYKLTPECSFRFRCAFLHNRPPSASSAWELTGTVTVSHTHGCELTNWWKSLSARCAVHWPPLSTCPNSHDYTLHTCSITASKCISRLVRLRPPSSPFHGLQMHIFKLARSRPPSASPNSLDHGLSVYLWVHSIIISRRTSNCSLAPPAACPDMQCVDG